MRADIVVSADAQETVGNYRVAVQKIVPEQMGNYRVIVAGSGNPSLIESFTIVLKRALSVNPTGTIEGFVAATEEELKKFYEVDVRLQMKARP
jgi:hypothetical protein